MSKEIQISSTGLQQTETQQTSFTHQGDYGVQIANQGTVIASPSAVNVYYHSNNGAVYNAANPIRTDCYNLFVVDDDVLNEAFFTMGKELALTVAEDVAPEISSQFSSLSNEAIEIIKAFPALFATKNRCYGHTDNDHLAYFGFVTAVSIQENTIKIYYQRLCAVPQQLINEIAPRLGIKGSSTYNELCRPHWTIKSLNLIEELKVAGVNILFST